jgi:xanthine/uracil/vitamin C permease (AzgA family)
MQPQEIQDASFYTEIRAGLTTFATMAYIIAVNVSASNRHPESLKPYRLFNIRSRQTYCQRRAVLAFASQHLAKTILVRTSKNMYCARTVRE